MLANVILWYFKSFLVVIIIKARSNKPFNAELRLLMALIKSENWLNVKKRVPTKNVNSWKIAIKFPR